MLHKRRLVDTTIIHVGRRKSWLSFFVLSYNRAHGELYARGRCRGIKINLRPGALEFRCKIVQVFGEDPCLILSFVVRNETVSAAGLLDTVPEIGRLCQTFRRVIFWRKCPLETKRMVWAGPESKRKGFPGGNACGIGAGNDTVVAVFVATKSVFRVHEDEFDEVWEHFVELNGVDERRIRRVDNGISHFSQR